jgi:hypothetical protein
MSYHTRFTGQFNLDKPLTLEQFNILNDFSEADHRSESGMPGYYCGWVPTKDGTAIECDDGDLSFYDFDEWLEYLIEHFLKPWGYTLDGTTRWQGDEVGDTGTLSVRNNVVTMRKDEETGEQIKDLVLDALQTEGAHHKQHYLWKIADLLGIERDEIDAEEGIAP